jgi:hypothetical protein
MAMTRHVLALLLPCIGIVVIAMLWTCSRCGVIYIDLCDCHVCVCHVIAVPMPCPGYVFVMLLHDVALRGSLVRVLVQGYRH